MERREGTRDRKDGRWERRRIKRNMAFHMACPITWLIFLLYKLLVIAGLYEIGAHKASL
jgi:hypothetical protein